MVKGIGHAAFNVKDMERTIAFYENTLGFKRAFDIQRPENRNQGLLATRVADRSFLLWQKNIKNF